MVKEIYGSSKEWVSVEVKLSQSLDPSTLFHLTDNEAGDRFYMRLNDNRTSYFGYKAIQLFKNNSKNKQSIFKDWEKLKHNITFIHPQSEKHHLRVVGGFQFSSHKSDDEWREFGLNHFVLPEVLISTDNNGTFLTYTVKRESFTVEALNDLMDLFNNISDIDVDEQIGEITRNEDIYKDDWRQLVVEAIESINNEEKIVLARRRLIKFDKDISIPYILKQAYSKEKNSYIFLLESQDSIFFSQTPEQLIKVNNKILSTKAVAGTIKRSQDEDDIKPYITELHYDKTPKILKNDHLYHLYTEIKAPLKDDSYISLIDNLHPTPALGGYPKEFAMDFIEQKEFGTRGLYGAPVGYIDIYDDCEFIVAIRSMLIKKAQATLFAGCGIVKDSDPDSELAETNLKFTPMMNALGVDMNGKS
ncbi:isochorismate synthase MenF [Staphylococcus aureus]|uniref:isochorismate synthase MenF n=1 Tax=Staphylococcus aureus TaxID=1280 RepID=UPI002FCE098B